ncbi:MAG TPA: exo-beta-N-acetylmuramidase NamZ domain-containing protein [Bryobacteraceae bacterium]|nr:exo-beta-N-acetylmuramidase NamZ domain-containing protein [Bryobacteraceae bacterium]
MKLAALLGLCAVAAFAQAGFPKAAEADAAIDRAIADGQIPGAVLVVGHDGQVVYRKAYGSRVLIPQREPMTADTIFDLASLTKVLATTPCLMKLLEDGRIRIDDPVTTYLPQFQGGHSAITLRNLMTHFSGLKPDLDLTARWSGYETGIAMALADKPAGPPGVRFVYSDINFILLGEIVHRLSGQTLAEYARRLVYEPLHMNDTMFQPPANLRARIAATEIDPDTGEPLRGVVHDPTARRMGGIAGHAGVFGTADDVAKFCQMMLDHGAGLFNPLTVEKFTIPQSPPDQPILRGLGWDIDSPFSGNRGDLFPVGSYGHTGFTGTSIWIDPFSRTYVILLTNAVHPHHTKPITSLRGRIATLAAVAYGVKPGVKIAGFDETIIGPGVHRKVCFNAQVRTGLDVLRERNFDVLRGRHIGLITNQTGIDRDGKRNIDLMREAGIDIRALFSPEHGISGREDRENVPDSHDPATGIPVWSLYQSGRKRLNNELLSDIDMLVFDIQDAGARFYTYSCTMQYAMEEAAKRRVAFVVLDRPNPITGVHMEGPMMDKELESFVGCAEIPLRHGMTLGELATMYNDRLGLGLDLRVVRMEGWQRGFWFDSTGLPWVNPSPNMRSLQEALLYPGVAMLEASKNYSVGRGTDTPFEQIGADWIDGHRLAAYLGMRHVPGVQILPARFRPEASNFKGKWIEGVRFSIADRDAFDSTRLGIEIAAALEHLWPGRLDLEADRWLMGNRRLLEDLRAGKDPRTLVQTMRDSLAAFVQERKSWLLYAE